MNKVHEGTGVGTVDEESEAEGTVNDDVKGQE